MGSMGVYLVILGLEMEPFELELDRREEPDVLELERLLDPDELDLERRFVAASDNSIITTTVNDRNSTVVIRIVPACSLSRLQFCVDESIKRKLCQMRQIQVTYMPH